MDVQHDEEDEQQDDVGVQDPGKDVDEILESTIAMYQRSAPHDAQILQSLLAARVTSCSGRPDKHSSARVLPELGASSIVYHSSSTTPYHPCHVAVWCNVQNQE